VCSGQGVSVGDLAAEVLKAAAVDATLVPDASLQRAVDVPVLVGQNDRLREDTGWAPARSRADIITDLLNNAASF
jgi:UDP-glucose 4-epimerase